jgi:hypothetical protein
MRLNDEPGPFLARANERVQERIDLINAELNDPGEWLVFGSMSATNLGPGTRDERRDKLIDVAATALLTLALLECEDEPDEPAQQE